MAIREVKCGSDLLYPEAVADRPYLVAPEIGAAERESCEAQDVGCDPLSLKGG